MNTTDAPTGYKYESADAAHTHAYLFPTVLAELSAHPFPSGAKRVFDLGCGTGATAAALADRGFDVSGVDPSDDAIRLAREARPHLRLEAGSASDDLAGRFGRYPAVVSLEVVEHVFHPRQYARCVFDLLEPGGVAILSTPYHGYWKNLALAVTGKMDAHFTALWDYGHIKFWSVKTLTELLTEAGFEVLRFHRVGRVPLLAKSMIAVARRPA